MENIIPAVKCLQTTNATNGLSYIFTNVADIYHLKPNHPISF